MGFELKAISYKRADVALTTRFTEPLYKQLCALKKHTGVPLNSIVLQACEYALKDLPEEIKMPYK